ncbi:DUF4352 domain-containing protein [Aquisalibacillus elongatus]|uniref:Uncharacterized protein DUF4352 n=1 Tax=Aquisalibacillus elongatus TaxID=485577 RepID=A0A3N5B3E4_9BACI|nr:DUF4352 domain-containing protein [Aquisalibacillus elongatus]RPF52176.1 uncharacterized protein DUF4352 [Aquisalibacillus elongatus]
MKKLLAILFATSLVLAACGGDETEEQDNTSDDQTQDEQSENNGESESSTEETDGSTEETSEDAQVGDVVETEGGTFTLQAKTDSEQTFETGPIVLTVEQVVTASGELEGDMAEFMEADELDYVQVDLTVENTSDDDMTFYAGQGTMATSTGEQLDPDMWLSDHIEGDMMANTKASGSFYYVLENSNAEDVEHVRLKFSAPYNTESFDDVGEELDFEIQLNQ